LVAEPRWFDYELVFGVQRAANALRMSRRCIFAPRESATPTRKNFLPYATGSFQPKQSSIY